MSILGSGRTRLPGSNTPSFSTFSAFASLISPFSGFSTFSFFSGFSGFSGFSIFSFFSNFSDFSGFSNFSGFSSLTKSLAISGKSLSKKSFSGVFPTSNGLLPPTSPRMAADRAPQSLIGCQVGLLQVDQLSGQRVPWNPVWRSCCLYLALPWRCPQTAGFTIRPDHVQSSEAVSTRIYRNGSSRSSRRRAPFRWSNSASAVLIG